jgi:hypothetical protein
MAPAGAQTGIVDGWARLVTRESVEEQGIGLECGWSPIKLAQAVEQDAGTAVHGFDDAADVDVKIAVLAELTDLFAILPGIDDGEDTLLVRRIWRADIEVARTVGEFDDVIDVGGDAYILVEQPARLVGGDTGLDVTREGKA